MKRRIEIEARSNPKIFTHIASVFSRRMIKLECYMSKETNNSSRISITAFDGENFPVLINDLRSHNDILNISVK